MKKLNERIFEMQRIESEFEDELYDLGDTDFDCCIFDAYDNSVVIKGMDSDGKLNSMQHDFIKKSGFDRIYMEFIN